MRACTAWMRPLVVAVLLASASGCNEGASEPALSPVPDAAQELPWPDDGRSPLPAMSLPPGPSALPPELCTWAASLDAIVLGTLVDVRLQYEPAIQIIEDEELERQDRWRYVEECATFLSPALALELQVDKTLRGEVGDRVVAVLGHTHRENLHPMPGPGYNGELVWRPTEREDILVDALRPGQVLGLSLHYVPEHDLWSLMGEIMFGVDGSGNIIFQYREGWEPGPEEAVGLSPEAFRDAVAACEESSASADRRSSTWRSWGPEGRPPHYYRAAHCSLPVQPAPPECERDSDCDEGMTCRDDNYCV
jgi:hypothetical protein